MKANGLGCYQRAEKEKGKIESKVNNLRKENVREVIWNSLDGDRASVKITEQDKCTGNAVCGNLES